MFWAIIDVGPAATGPGPCKEPVNKVKQNNGDSKAADCDVFIVFGGRQTRRSIIISHRIIGT